MVFFKTIKFRISNKEIKATIAWVESIINNKKFKKLEDLQDEWQITLTQIERK